MWPHFVDWLGQGLGKREKWMPFHTILGTHELFAVEKIHQNTDWDMHRRFFALFIYRAHCRQDLFETVQLPFMHTIDFWDNPCRHFEDDGMVTRAMLEYRRTTKAPLQTGAFRCIPMRLVRDNDENLVINIARRTKTLLEVAEKLWLIINDGSTSSSEKFSGISEVVRQSKGMGDTWTKMILVSIDIAFPDLRLLTERCEVGRGAIDGLKRLLPDSGGAHFANQTSQELLIFVTGVVNAQDDAVSNRSHLWDLLSQVEAFARTKFRNLPLVVRHMDTTQHELGAGTVQVQLCEWRQFHGRPRKGLSPRDDVDGDSQLGWGRKTCSLRSFLPAPRPAQEG